MWAVDPETGAAGWYPITWTTKHEDADLVTLSVTPVGVDGEALSSTQEHTIVVTITATLEHPFWVEGWEPSGYWMNAGDLQAGDTLLSADGRRLVVQAAVRSSGPAMVYNFTVDALHTYTVTKLRVVVHNVGNCNRTYEPNSKHGNVDRGKASQMDLDDTTAQKVLEAGMESESEGSSKIFGIHNKKIYTFQEHTLGKYHGYHSGPNARDMTPFFRYLKVNKLITEAEYGKLIRNKTIH